MLRLNKAKRIQECVFDCICTVSLNIQHAKTQTSHKQVCVY